MNVIVLTSSRADYGIYLPLLKKLKADHFFDLKIVAFGAHMSDRHGKTLNAILNDGFEVSYQIKTSVEDDSPNGISLSMAKTMSDFASMWEKEKKTCDLIICLGDRYEMFAAVAASVPFVIPVAHIHGGETTLGAIDNKFRHSLTMMSEIHFASTDNYARRVAEMKGSPEKIYNVGALGLDNLSEIRILSKEEFKEKFNIELKDPILVTFHPETVEYEKNENYIDELIAALDVQTKQIVVTMPNADTNGQVIRKKLQDFAQLNPRVVLVESLGTQGYFSCMRHCSFMLGNSSSGIIEAASFGKYVLNLGKRQAGRDAGKNVISCEIEKYKILAAIKKIESAPDPGTFNIYYNGGAAEKIVGALKK